MKVPDPDDRDPTGEEAIPEFDGTRTDQLDDTYRFRVVTQSEDAFAIIDHDERGQARLKWIADLAPRSSDETFDELEALANDSLSIADPEQPSAQCSLAKRDGAGGYDPYDVIPTPKPKK